MRSILIYLTLSLLIISCKKDSGKECLPPSSDVVRIVVLNPDGSNFIETNVPNYTPILTDNFGDHYLHAQPTIVGNDTIQAWEFDLRNMESDFTYIITYDNYPNDTVSAQWTLESTVCDGVSHYYRSLNQFRYNDSIFLSPDIHYVTK